MKKYIFLAILLIIAGGVYWFMTNFESIVKKVVHKYGSEVTLTDVNIDGLDISLKNGTAAINKITVANPKGYDTKNLFELGQISVKIDLKSLTTDTIIIENVDVKKPVVSYEMITLTQNNISQILDNVKGYSARKAKESGTTEAKKVETPKETSTDSGSSKKVIIKKITIDQGELNAIANLNIPGLELDKNKVSVKLPKIVITGIGENKKNGEDVASVITRVITEILSTASQTVVSSNLGDLKDLARQNLEGAVLSTKDRINESGALIKDQAKQSQDMVKDTANQAKDLVNDTLSIFK